MHSCPQCGDTVTKEQKFCSNCAWKVDSTIFDQEGIICTGQNDDGTACGRQLTNNSKFCPDCATPVKKADADVPVSDSNLSAADNPLTLQNVQNTIGSTDLEVEQHNNGIGHSAEQGQTIPNQNVSEDSLIKNSDIANGNSKEITSPSVSTPSDTVAAVKLVTGQKTPEPNAEDQKGNPISTQKSPEQASKYVSEDPTPESKLLSKGQTQDNPTSKKQMSDPESKPFSSEQVGVKRDGHKMEVSSSGSKNKTCHTQSSTDEPILESPPKKQKVSDESTSIQPKLTSENKNVTVTTQPHSVFGSTMSQEKTTASETSTEVQAGPSSERFQDSFIFGKASNVTNPSYCKGEDISDKHDNKKSKEIEEGQNGKNGAGGESSLASEKDRGKQDKETSEDDSSESSDSDSGKSGEGNKDLPLEQKKKKKNRKKTKKIKEEKKKERKRRKENKDGNQNTSIDKNLSTETKKGKNSKNTSTVDTNNSPAGDNTSGSQRQQTSSKKTFAETVTGTSTNTSKKQETVKKQTTGSFVDVCFHVIITPTILINPDKDFVVIAFENYGGGWDSKKHKLKFERPRPDGYIVATVTVGVPKVLVSPQSSGSFYYNYCVYHGDSKNQRTWEYFYRALGSGDLDNSGFKRSLIVPSEYSSKGLYHCYDGVAREDPRLDRNKSKNFWVYVKDSVKKLFGLDTYHKQLVEDAELAILAFQPKWQVKSMKSDGLNGEEMISQVKLIMEGLRRVYVQEIGLMYGSGFDPLFAGVLSPYMKKIIHALVEIGRNQTGVEMKTLRLVSAVTVTYIIDEYGIKMDYKEKRMLCEALLPNPDFETKTSEDVDNLKSFLPKSYRKVSQSVLKFCRKIAGNSSDPSWMFCVPIIHFMFENSKPFIKAPPKVNHDASVPVWWGVEDFGNDIDHFKWQSKWDRSSDEIFKPLIPYFEVDYLLPRTLLASLKQEMLHDIVTTYRIPPDISLASTCYYLKKTTNMGLLKKLIEYISTQCSSDNPERKEDYLRQYEQNVLYK